MELSARKRVEISVKQDSDTVILPKCVITEKRVERAISENGVRMKRWTSYVAKDIIKRVCMRVIILIISSMVRWTAGQWQPRNPPR